MMIYMLSTQRGSPDGFAMKRYHEAKHCDVPHSLGAHFINKGWAIEVPAEDYSPIVNGLPNVNMVDVLQRLPNQFMRHFNAGHEARKIVGEMDICNID